MSTPLTSDQAIALLREQADGYRTPESLRSLAARVDADAPGKLTVLYSGPTTKDVWSSDVGFITRTARKADRGTTTPRSHSKAGRGLSPTRSPSAA